MDDKFLLGFNKLRGIEAKILVYLLRNGKGKQAEIGREMDETRQNVYHHAIRLVDAGLIIREGKEYKLAEDWTDKIRDLGISKS